MDVASDRSSPRNRTREEVFGVIEHHGSVTRARLIEVMGLSRSTVNHAVAQLIAAGRVAEEDAGAKGPGSGSGRPAGTLRIIPHGAPAGALDFGHAHIKAAVIDAEGRILSRRRTALDVDLQAEQALDLGTRMLDELRREAGLGDLGAVVAGIPGPLDAATGLVRSPTILSSWVGLDPRAELGRRLGTTVHVENDAVLGALGELRDGAGRGFRDFLYVRASHGIGAGLVLGGEPYRGSLGFAGEIGHTPLPGHTELCRCGNRGCLEAVVSVASIRVQFDHTHPHDRGATLRYDRGGDPITQRILDDAGRLLGGVLAVLCNLLNPAALIIGGELGASDGPLLDGVADTVQRYAQPAIAGSLTVLPAGLGVDAELVGAATMAASLARR
ncbi:ROK family transcriptional regulator [Actinacidiphila rubida]|uniref:Sugar kinase of the NBD/HSP70 family, may contain an N-terminal HTH domain n=1 Tax=Actinacidiphila rubida TaxID=310780 RepID=A0A1H8KNS8_9ACTN|nr:ROK family transcriptional regulator [Actinacidiphila rubida]SEN94544.1 Sugar kinase of the NBD/HSP70 family, may contain an N-terminal HTH domain [Actinacidiphila rubida]